MEEYCFGDGFKCLLDNVPKEELYFEQHKEGLKDAKVIEGTIWCHIFIVFSRRK